MIAQFNHFEIQMTKKQAESCHHSGECILDVQALIKSKKVSRQKKCTPEKLKAELKEYDVWTDDELNNDSKNWEKIIWIAAGNIINDM